MSGRPARFTEAEVKRLIRAARKAGLAVARVTLPDGTKMEVDLSPQSTGDDKPEKLAPKREVVL